MLATGGNGSSCGDEAKWASVKLRTRVQDEEEKSQLGAGAQVTSGYVEDTDTLDTYDFE